MPRGDAMTKTLIASLNLNRMSYPIKKIEKPNKHLQIRTTPDGRKYEWHPTKGFRRWIK
jgi:hypothetical protein